MMSGIVGRALREHRGPLRRSALAGGVVALASIGLAMSSAWLIARSAQRPAILSLTVPMGLVQLFALGKAAGRYVERTSTHRAALGVMGSIRYHLARQLLPLLPAGLGPRSAEVVDVALSDVERVQDLLVVLAGPLLTSVVAGLLTVAVDAGVEWRAGLVVVAALIVSVVVVPVLAWKAGKKTQRELGSARAELRALWSDVASAGDEMIFGGQRQPVAERLDRLEDALDTASRRHATLVGMVQGTMTLLAGVTVLVTVLVARSDVSHHHLAAVLERLPAQHPQPLTERQELRIGFDVGDEVEHLGRRMAHAARGAERRHDGSKFRQRLIEHMRAAVNVAEQRPFALGFYGSEPPRKTPQGDEPPPRRHLDHAAERLVIAALHGLQIRFDERHAQHDAQSLHQPAFSQAGHTNQQAVTIT